MAFSFALSAGGQPTQGKSEGWKTMQTLEMNMDYFDYSVLVSPQKENTATTKEGPSLLVEVQPRKFRKYGQVENIAVHLQNAPTYYFKYGKEKDRIKAKIGL